MPAPVMPALCMVDLNSAFALHGGIQFLFSFLSEYIDWQLDSHVKFVDSSNMLT
jgi:hypothetical protein